ncbi:MAG: sigma-70 family RNA polymerase sigma factor [Bryobacterales bacterium]|nr:sigma-70 family RNA polymerase sigma factor [Bryobacterales bacterium]
MSSSSVTDSGLSPEAITRLVEGRQQFLSFLEKRVQSKAAAEDILQAAFVRSLEKGGSVRDEESVVAWFYRVLRNAIIDHYRQRGSAERVSEQLVAHLQDHQEPDELFKGEICQCVTALLENVKPEYREAIQAVDLEDGSLADLAARASITANNAAVRVHRAREALRKQVVTACGICATHGCIECHCKPKSQPGCH